jgi:hypothetical protein
MANEKLNVEFNRNEDHLKLQVGEFKHKLKKIQLRRRRKKDRRPAQARKNDGSGTSGLFN